MSNSERNRTVPIHKVVAAAMVDLYGDISQAGLQQTLMFNAARGFRKLNNEVLKRGMRKVTLHVNSNTHTATLPVDFYEESFVGVIDDRGQRVPLRLRTDLTDTNNIDDIECEGKCPKCSQPSSICQELSITESTQIVVLNGGTYEQTIIKKLYPNGDYFIETKTPVINILPSADEVKATGSIQIIRLGSTGAKFNLVILNQLIGEYIQAVTDTDLETLAASIVNQFNGVNGYEFTSNGTLIIIKGAAGLGASLNGGNNIVLTLTQVNFGTGGLGTIHPALAATVSQFSGGVSASTGAAGAVTYVTQKEFIRKLDLKECGCIEESQENIDFIRTNNFDCFCSHFAPCCNNTLDASYQIFEETGLIKFNPNFQFSKVYLEYQGFLPKKNGQYQIPEICFETLVQWIKWKSVENRKSVSLSERNFVWQHYLIERGNMEKLNSRFSLQNIIQSIGLIPKFDVEYHPVDYCFTPKEEVMATNNGCVTTAVACPPTSSKSFTPFSILTSAGNGIGSPTVGINIFQDDRLKNAIGIESIFINNTQFTRTQFNNQIVKDFSINTVTGTLSIFQGDGSTPRNWDSGDVLVIPTFFKLV